MAGKTQKDGYQIVHFPRVREFVIDVMVPAERKHMIHILFEADVNDVLKYREKKKIEGAAAPSITAFIIKCVADVAMTNKRIAALRFASRKLAIFDDMHVSCNVEKEIDGQSQPLGLVIRQANRKNINEIHDEIHSYATEGFKKQIEPMKKFVKLPRFLRAIFFSSMFTNPNKIVNQGFNIIVTSMGMFGAGGGHIIPYQHCSLCISIGGITRKPGVVDDRIEAREHLSITATFDHDITDGAPAARFAQDLKEYIERGHGLLSKE
ncbi:MAG: 2-oxo acid dehydrogenase subunit E2 [Anaerolineaceae bacterium]|nr:MAG: 2-oxo acid dehydrogenase subunit E2 [Anaerolineaceae bacterium]